MTKSVRSYSARGEETRNLILETAIAQFARFGFRRTTLTGIAEEAGISKATIYLYFDNKADLFRRLIEREAERVHGLVQAAVDGAVGTGAKLRAFVHARYRHVDSLMTLHRADRRVLLEDRPRVEEMAAGFSVQEQRLVESILRAGMAAGELDVPDPPLAALAITGALRSLDLPILYSDEPIDVEASLDALIELFLRGLTRRGDRGSREAKA